MLDLPDPFDLETVLAVARKAGCVRIRLGEIEAVFAFQGSTHNSPVEIADDGTPVIKAQPVTGDVRDPRLWPAGRPTFRSAAVISE